MANRSANRRKRSISRSKWITFRNAEKRYLFSYYINNYGERIVFFSVCLCRRLKCVASNKWAVAFFKLSNIATMSIRRKKLGRRLYDALRFRVARSIWITTKKLFAQNELFIYFVWMMKCHLFRVDVGISGMKHWFRRLFGKLTFFRAHNVLTHNTCMQIKFGI